MRAQPGVPGTAARSSDAGEPCLEPSELALFIDGELSGEGVDALIVHVDRCESCCELVQELARGDTGSSSRAIGRYELGNVLGAGAMGVVYEAWDPKLQRRVALKVVRPERASDEEIARSLNEARALARVNHPNVVTVFDVTEAGDEICVATELVDGETLATWQRGRPRPDVVGAWLQAARGVAAAHAVGVIHRDIKPANMLIDREGRVRVGDFGIARLRDEPPPATAERRPPRAPTVAGTPAYMAPEQVHGEADARADQYALCVSLAEGLTGTPPPAGQVPPIVGTLGDVLARGLRVDPAARFPTMDALIAALEATTRPPPRRWPYVAAVLAAVAGGIAVTALRPPARECTLEPLPAVWTPDRRAAVALEAGEPLARYVDDWLASWSAVAADLCARQPDPVVERRQRACLHDLVLRLEARLGRVVPGRPAFDAWMAVEDVARPTRCAAALVGDALEPTRAQAAALASPRRALYAGELSPEGCELLLASAKTIAFPPFEVEASLACAEAIWSASEPRARALLDGAVALATARGDELTRILAASAAILHAPANTIPDVKQRTEATRRQIAAIGGDRELEGDLDYVYGTVLRAHGLALESIAAYHRATAAYRASFGQASVHVALLQLLLASTYAILDRDSADAREAWSTAVAIYAQLGLDPLPLIDLGPSVDPARTIEQLTKVLARYRTSSRHTSALEAALGASYDLAGNSEDSLAHYERARDIADRLRLRDASTTRTLINLAGVQNDLGRHEQALATARRALRESADLPLESWRSVAMAEAGRAHLALGDPAAAREVLDAAVRLNDRAGEKPRFRARTLGLYARALWSVDRRRARLIAGSALRDYESAIRDLDAANPAERVFGARLRADRDQIASLLSRRARGDTDAGSRR